MSISLNPSNTVRRQEIMEHLRNRFRKEYLSQLISKSHVKETPKLRVGDVVLLGEDNLKRVKWPLARIEKLIVGKDGMPRVAILKTKDGQLTRPVQRLYPLEIGSDGASGVDNVRKDVSEPVNDETIGEKDHCEPRDCNKKEIKTRSGRIVRKPKLYK